MAGSGHTVPWRTIGPCVCLAICAVRGRVWSRVPATYVGDRPVVRSNIMLGFRPLSVAKRMSRVPVTLDQDLLVVVVFGLLVRDPGALREQLLDVDLHPCPRSKIWLDHACAHQKSAVCCSLTTPTESEKSNLWTHLLGKESWSCPSLPTRVTEHKIQRSCFCPIISNLGNIPI